jgi:chromate transport protein ChrA
MCIVVAVSKAVCVFIAGLLMLAPSILVLSMLAQFMRRVKSALSESSGQIVL